MRTKSGMAVLAALATASAVVYAGCGTAYDDIYLKLTDRKLARWDDGGSGGGGGGDGGPPPECAGNPTQDATLVRDECGVFVSASAVEDGNGTKTRPFTKLTDAITEAESTGKRVYACAGKAFAEAVTLSAGIDVYGGFDCANAWAWSPLARATLDGPVDSIALTIQASAAGARVDGFKITAASPSDMKSGNSSIAVAVADVHVTLERCDTIASNAADGADGVAPSDLATKGSDAPDPDPLTMNACINAASVNGGAPGVTTCEDGESSGGLGGKGGVTGTNDGDGEKGGDGTPLDPIDGLGGTGESATKCSSGATGTDGEAGNAGLGGAALDDALSLSGITNNTATNGKSGTKAQGGGGGGGAKSGVFCPPAATPVDGPGASGGGGGGGGCGGKGGGGGKAGGSSIAILSLGTKLVLNDVTLAVGKAGNGGKGASGQNGGDPGVGAAGGAKSVTPPSANGCKGGDGGSGGPGGAGGGGRGGHAIGIAFAKTPSVLPMIKSSTPGTAGDPGSPGAVGGNSGEQGKAGQCWDFEKHAECGL